MSYPAWTPDANMANCTKAEVSNFSKNYNATVRQLAKTLGEDGIIVANGIVTREYKEIASGWMDDQT